MAYTYLRNGVCHKDSFALIFFSAYSSQVFGPFHSTKLSWSRSTAASFQLKSKANFSVLLFGLFKTGTSSFPVKCLLSFWDARLSQCSSSLTGRPAVLSLLPVLPLLPDSACRGVWVSFPWLFPSSLTGRMWRGFIQFRDFKHHLEADGSHFYISSPSFSLEFQIRIPTVDFTAPLRYVNLSLM